MSFNMTNQFVNLGLPGVLILGQFLIFYAHGGKFSLPDAFAAMAILGRLRGPLWGMPWFLAILTEFQVSVQRIESFLRCKEID